MAIPDDVRIAAGFFSHPKTRKLNKALGLEGVIAFIKVWIFAAQFRPKGILYDFDESEIEEAAGWRGEDGALISTLLAVGYLKLSTGPHRGAYEIHDWKVHQPHVYFSPEREDRAREMAGKRWGANSDKYSLKKQPFNATSKANSNTNGNTGGNAITNASLRAPSPSPSPEEGERRRTEGPESAPSAPPREGGNGASQTLQKPPGEKCNTLGCAKRGTIKVGSSWYCNLHQDLEENPIPPILNSITKRGQPT